jgi:hypothetical protein
MDSVRGGDGLHPPSYDDGYVDQREVKLREEQETFPNEIWERGEGGA